LGRGVVSTLSRRRHTLKPQVLFQASAFVIYGEKSDSGRDLSPRNAFSTIINIPPIFHTHSFITHAVQLKKKRIISLNKPTKIIFTLTL